MHHCFVSPVSTTWIKQRVALRRREGGNLLPFPIYPHTRLILNNFIKILRLSEFIGVVEVKEHNIIYRYTYLDHHLCSSVWWQFLQNLSHCSDQIQSTCVEGDVAKVPVRKQQYQKLFPLTHNLQIKNVNFCCNKLIRTKTIGC